MLESAVHLSNCIVTDVLEKFHLTGKIIDFFLWRQLQ